MPGPIQHPDLPATTIPFPRSLESKQNLCPFHPLQSISIVAHSISFSVDFETIHHLPESATTQHLHHVWSSVSIAAPPALNPTSPSSLSDFAALRYAQRRGTPPSRRTRGAAGEEPAALILREFRLRLSTSSHISYSPVPPLSAYSARLAHIAGGVGPGVGTPSSGRSNADQNPLPSADLGLIGLAVM